MTMAASVKSDGNDAVPAVGRTSGAAASRQPT